jgi:hypothetical protein
MIFESRICDNLGFSIFKDINYYKYKNKIIIMTNRLYEKNQRGYVKLLDYSAKIGLVGGLIGVIVGNFFKIPELVE